MMRLLLYLLSRIARWLEPEGTPRVEAQIDDADCMGEEWRESK